VALSFVQKEEMQSFLSPVLDNEFSQTHPDSGTSTQGRSIGGVRDKSAPTVGGGPTL